MEKIDIEELVKLFGEKDLALLSLRQEIKALKAENEALKKQLGSKPKKGPGE